MQRFGGGYASYKRKHSFNIGPKLLSQRKR